MKTKTLYGDIGIRRNALHSRIIVQCGDEEGGQIRVLLTPAQAKDVIDRIAHEMYQIELFKGFQVESQETKP